MEALAFDHLVQAGRAPWKIEHEHNTVLKKPKAIISTIPMAMANSTWRPYDSR